MSGTPTESKTTKDLLRRVEEERATESTPEQSSQPKAEDNNTSQSSSPSRETSSDVKKVRSFSSYMSNRKQRQVELDELKRKEEEEKEERLRKEKEMEEEKIRLAQETERERIAEETRLKLEEEQRNDEAVLKAAEEKQRNEDSEPSNHKPETTDVKDTVMKDASISDPSLTKSPLETADPVTAPATTTVIPSPTKSEADIPMSQIISSELSHLPTSDDREMKSKGDYPETIPEAEATPESTLKKQKQDIPSDEDSEAETVYTDSPPKKRGRLIRKSEIDGGSRPIKRVDFDESDDDASSDEDVVRKRKKKSYGALNRASRSSSRGRNPKKPKGTVDHSGRQMLQRVCEKGNYDQAKELIEAGADVNHADYAGNTALHEAALMGHTEIVELLLENGARADIQNGSEDLDTPLIDAAANGHVETVKVLLKYGADPRIENTKGQNALDSLEDGGAATESLKNMLREATIKLTREGKKLESGQNSDVDERSRSRSRPRGSAGRRVPSARSDMMWIDFASPRSLEEVYRRAMEGDLEFIARYLQNVKKPDPEAFVIAAKFGHTDVVSLFLAFGAKADVPNENGQTALMRTVGRGHLETVKLLLESGASVRRTCKDGKNALRYAKDSLVVDQKEIAMLEAAMNGQPVTLSMDNDTHTGTSSSKTAKDTKDTKPSHEMKKSVSKESLTDSDAKREQHKKRKLSQKEEPRDGPDASSEIKRKKVAKIDVPDEPKSSDGKPKIGERKSSSSFKPEVKRVVSGSKTELKPPAREPEPPAPPPPETEEEKQARLLREKEDQKRREQYEAERLAKRKAREQQFLSNFETEEKKKEQELAKLSKLEQERKQKEAEAQEAKLLEQKRLQEEKVKTEDFEKRQKLRELYPTGLRLASFSSTVRPKEACLGFSPFYKVPIDGTDYVVDLQLIMALGLEQFVSQYKTELYEGAKQLTKSDKNKMFTFLYPLIGDFRISSIKDKLENMEVERTRLYRLKVCWLKYDDVIKVLERDFADYVSLFKSHTVLVDWDNIPDVIKKSIMSPDESATKRTVSGTAGVVAMKRNLPVKLRYHSAMVKSLARNKRLW